MRIESKENLSARRKINREPVAKLKRKGNGRIGLNLLSAVFVAVNNSRNEHKSELY